MPAFHNPQSRELLSSGKSLSLNTRSGELRFTHCVWCSQPFVFGITGNVFTEAGERETQISGMCEACFDEACEDEGI